MAKVPNTSEMLCNRLSRAREHYRQTTDRQTDDRQTDGQQHIANVNVSSRSLKRRQSPLPNFRPISIVAKRLDLQDPTWYEGRPQPR